MSFDQFDSGWVLPLLGLIAIMGIAFFRNRGVSTGTAVMSVGVICAIAVLVLVVAYLFFLISHSK
jgi:hypothetical protein